MQVHYRLSEFEKLPNAVATIGTFDGVHLGHQKILKSLTATAQLLKVPSVVITFWPHPRKVLQPKVGEIKILYTLPERIEMLSNFGIDHLIVIPFDVAFSKTTSEDFITKIIIETIGAHTLILGYDHRFGNNREGSFEYLKTNASRYGLRLIEISRQDIDEAAISSSRIRNAIAQSNMAIANQLLGHRFYITGKVVHGQMLGQKIGFPTANIQVAHSDKILPPDGVYAVWVTHEGKQYQGMMNIGYRPTVDGSTHHLEVHIMDFNENLYGKEIKISFEKKLRNEQRFESLDQLKTQLQHDKLAAHKALSHHEIL